MALALVSTKDASSIPGKTNGSQNISSTQFPPNGQPKNHCMSRDPFAKPDNLMPIHPRATGANAFPCALYRKYSIGSLSPKYYLHVSNFHGLPLSTLTAFPKPKTTLLLRKTNTRPGNLCPTMAEVTPLPQEIPKNLLHLLNHTFRQNEQG